MLAGLDQPVNSSFWVTPVHVLEKKFSLYPHTILAVSAFAQTPLSE